MFGSLFYAIEVCLHCFSRVFDAASSERKIKVLSLSRIEIYAKYESLLTIFIRWKVALLCTFFISNAKEIISTDERKLVSKIFIVLVTTHLLKKKPKALSFVCARIYAKQSMLLTFRTIVFSILVIKLSLLHEIKNLFLWK
jgi:hypothetical protein